MACEKALLKALQRSKEKEENKACLEVGICPGCGQDIKHEQKEVNGTCWHMFNCAECGFQGKLFCCYLG